MEFKHIPQSEVTDNIFEEVMSIESSRESGYDRKSMQEHWRTSGKNDNFVCFMDNKIVGYITFNPNSIRRNGSVYMVNLTIHPEYTRKGIGRNLIAYACNYYNEKNYNKPMSTSVDKDNLAALKLYLECGFEIREPICEADEDDEQYIMDNSLENIKNKLEQINKENNNEQF